VASDLDGTLLRSDGTVSVRTRQALMRADLEGLSVVVVTGRSVHLMAGLSQVLGHQGIAICSNGSVVYDLATDSIKRHDAVTPVVAAAIVAALRAAIPEAIFAVDIAERFSREPGWEVRDYMQGREAAIATAEELIVEPITKIMARVDEVDPDELLTLVKSALGDLATATRSSEAGVVEISAAGVSKGSALQRFAEERGITAGEVIAIGDMPNDLPMLQWAGHCVAVANAHPEVLSTVDEITASNDEDGVADIIESLLRGYKI
jgi:Cof subfamily protein (haloacid dehalogenase superfamily)